MKTVATHDLETLEDAWHSDHNIIRYSTLNNLNVKLLFAGWLAYQYLSSQGYIRKTKKKPSKKTDGTIDNAEWLKGTYYGKTKPSR